MSKIIPSLTPNLRQPFSFACFLVWFVLLTACTAQSEISLTSLPVQETVTALPTMAATREPAATFTVSPPLTPTATATSTAVKPTVTATATRIPLPTATLTATEQQQRWQMVDTRIAAMMASNNDCQLPCWWGIEPGDSVTDALQIFNTIDENGWVGSFSPLLWGELEEIGFFDHFYKDEMGEMIYAGFLVHLITYGEQVAVFNIYAGRSVDFAAGTAEYNQIGERLIRDWGQFSAQNMFAKYGDPDLIYIMPRAPYYDINIYYPALGVAVSYLTDVSTNELGERTVCRDMLDMFNIRSMNLFLYDPSTELPPGYLRATYPLWPLNPELLVPEDTQMIELSSIENVAGMTIAEFVNLVLENDGGPACFTVK
jgi:hypothetical protein